jgi:hypothetical protein
LWKNWTKNRTKPKKKKEETKKKSGFGNRKPNGKKCRKHQDILNTAKKENK